METVTNTRSALHPVIWVAAIAVIAASAVGIAAMTGLISGADKTDPAAPVQFVPPVPAVAPQPIATPVPPAAVSAQPVAPKPTKHLAHKAQQIAPDNRLADAPIPPKYVPPAPICRECGVVESVRAVTQEGQGSGVGAVAGGVLGGALGHGVGQGTGRDLATIAGVVGGALLGNKVEKTQRTKTSYETTVKFEDGASRVFTSEASPPWRAGEKVLEVGGVLQYR
jgi:outer membrane lipoprotein SlyB